MDGAVHAEHRGLRPTVARPATDGLPGSLWRHSALDTKYRNTAYSAQHAYVRVVAPMDENIKKQYVFLTVWTKRVTFDTLLGYTNGAE